MPLMTPTSPATPPHVDLSQPAVARAVAAAIKLQESSVAELKKAGSKAETATIFERDDKALSAISDPLVDEIRSRAADGIRRFNEARGVIQHSFWAGGDDHDAKLSIDKLMKYDDRQFAKWVKVQKDPAAAQALEGLREVRSFRGAYEQLTNQKPTLRLFMIWERGNRDHYLDEHPHKAKGGASSSSSATDAATAASHVR